MSLDNQNNYEEFQFILNENNLYLILGVSKDADTLTITKAYKAIAKNCHPDNFLHLSPEKRPKNLDTIFIKITTAFNILKDLKERKKYDERIKWLTEQENITSGRGFSSPHPASTVKGFSSPLSTSQVKKTSNEVNKEKTKDEIKLDRSQRHFLEGKLFLVSNNIDQAIECFRSAVEIQHTNASYHSYLGLAMKKKGWEGYAQAEFKVALRFDPTDKIALANIASINENTKTEIKAKDNISANPASKNSSDFIFSENRNVKSKDEIKQELSHNLFLQGKSFFDSGNFDKAIECFKSALEIQQTNATYHSYLGLAMKKKGWEGYAQAEFKVALHFDPLNKIALENITPTTENTKSTQKTDKKTKPDEKTENSGALSRFFHQFLGKKKS